jgi:hypothetical protein
MQVNTSTRCPLTDLLPNQCGCRNHRGGQTPDEVVIANRNQLLRRPGWFPAQWPGYCARCGHAYADGTPITIETGLGWRAECCS